MAAVKSKRAVIMTADRQINGFDHCLEFSNLCLKEKGDFFKVGKFYEAWENSINFKK